MNEETIFAEAAAKSPGERDAYLDEACGDDAALRDRVESLLRSHDGAGSFLETPAEAELEGTLNLSAEDRVAILARAEEREDAAEEEADPSSADRGGDSPDGSAGENGGGGRVMYFGDYELQGEIARGAMGVVYRAEQKSLKRIVAIKMIRSTLLTSDEDVSRFLAEAEAAASLDHPNIVPIYEVGVHEEQHYFSMKLIEGGTLRDHLERLADDPRAAAKLMSTVAGAIHAAHQRGILHRDLKPGNILIDEAGEPHVTDFGLAKQMESNTSMTLSGQIMGTPNYMAPEQAQGGGKDLTTAADVYALGAILYELLCGRPPHKGESLMDTLKLVSEEEPERPSRHRPGIDRDLETIAMKCLARDPANRYASAQGLRNDLDRWLRGEPILARPVGALEKALKWMKRKPMHAAAAAASLLLLLTLGIGGPIQARNERDLREQAETAQAQAEANARRIRVQAYSADMNVAAHAVEEHRYTKARELLERHVPQPGEEDLRGFEWHYLQARAQSDDLGVIGEYQGLRGGIAVSPDDSLVAHNTETGIEVRDRTTGDVIRAIEVDWDIGDDGKQDDYRYGLIQFSPDGRHLLSVKAMRVRRWRTDDWEAEPILEGMGWPLVFSRDPSSPERFIAVALSGNRFSVYDGETFEKIRTLEGTYEREDRNFNSHSVALSTDGRTLLAAGGIVPHGVGTLCRWDVASGKQLSRVLPDHKASTCLAVSRNGLLAVGSWDGDVALWDTKSEKLVEILKPHIAWIPMIAFSRDGSKLLTTSADETICVFDIDGEGKATLRTRLAGHENEIWAIAMAGGEQLEDEGQFYTGSTDGTTRLWQIPSSEAAEYFAAHTVRGVGFEDEGRTLVSWSMEKDITVDGKRRPEGFYRLDLDSGEFEPIRDWKRPKDWEPGAFFYNIQPAYSRIHGEARVARRSRANPGLISIWNLEEGRDEVVIEEAGHIEKQYRGRPYAFSPDGSLFATANETNGIRVWDCSDWTHRDLVPEFPGRAELCFSADNRVLAALPPDSGEDCIAIEIATGRVLARFPLEGRAPEIAVSADGRFLAVGSTVREVQLWDLEKGEQVHSLRAHVAGIRGLAFSPDGRTLATCGDQRLKLWNVETGTELLVVVHDVVEIGDPMFSPDGRTLMANARDKWIRVWRVPAADDPGN